MTIFDERLEPGSFLEASLVHIRELSAIALQGLPMQATFSPHRALVVFSRTEGKRVQQCALRALMVEIDCPAP